MKFSDFGLTPPLLEGLDAMGFENPTPIQEQTIPLLMEGRDVLACAQTGTGKTAAFLLPIIHDLTESPPIEGVACLVLEPTRELAMQVDQQLEGFSYFTPVRAIAVYGGRDGHAMDQEKRALMEGAHIVLATPGRFISHLNLGNVRLENLKYLVLDEADRMLDMGFAPDILKIVNALPKNRQTILFSATMPGNIRKFAKELMKNPAEISLAVSKPAENIIQGAYEVSDDSKIDLAEILLTGKQNLQRVLVFTSSKVSTRQLAERLKRRGMKAEAIHSDLTQAEREERLHAFRSGALPVVVATDVLSRGIDIKGIDVVINYDVPHDAEDYVHRIGRTARAEASGVALTFINGKDRRKFKRIEELLGIEIRRLQLPEGIKGIRPGEESERSSGSGPRKNFRRNPPKKK